MVNFLRCFLFATYLQIGKWYLFQAHTNTMNVTSKNKIQQKNWFYIKEITFYSKLIVVKQELFFINSRFSSKKLKSNLVYICNNLLRNGRIDRSKTNTRKNQMKIFRTKKKNNQSLIPLVFAFLNH